MKDIKNALKYCTNFKKNFSLQKKILMNANFN